MENALSNGCEMVSKIFDFAIAIVRFYEFIHKSKRERKLNDKRHCRAAGLTGLYV
jgi:hypothetical protein